MRWPFRRRRPQETLGAAVTGIPGSAPCRVVPAAHGAIRSVPASEARTPPGPRVELGFRDGSTAALAPGSAQAKALTDIASVLTQRD
jgi:hypothetical protein